jgi:hypothetical protein
MLYPNLGCNMAVFRKLDSMVNFPEPPTRIDLLWRSHKKSRFVNRRGLYALIGALTD